MRILLDESVPRKLKRLLSGHEVSTVPEMGWAAKKNGELIRLATGRFDVFITIDKNLVKQQNLLGIPFAILVIDAPTNRLESLKPLVPGIQKALAGIAPGQVIKVDR